MGRSADFQQMFQPWIFTDTPTCTPQQEESAPFVAHKTYHKQNMHAGATSLMKTFIIIASEYTHLARHLNIKCGIYKCTVEH